MKQKPLYPLHLDEAAQYAEYLSLQCSIENAYRNREGSRAELGFPKSEYFSIEQFILELKNRRWRYDGIFRDVREQIDNSADRTQNNIEGGILDLIVYEGEETIDTANAVKNAERRIRRLCSSGGIPISFSSVVHARVLSQELHEAGWDLAKLEIKCQE